MHDSSPVYEGAFVLPAAQMRSQAHRTLSRFLAELYPEKRVRAALGRAGVWLNSYPPELYVPVAGMDLDRPVAVHLAPRTKGRRRFRFVTFDCDAKQEVTAAQAAADAALLAQAAQAEGISAVPTASGSPGGIHVWTGCVEGVAPAVVSRINTAAARLCPSLDKAPLANAAHGVVRPPGAAHRAGGYSTLTAHTVDEAIKALGADSAPARAFERLALRLEAIAAELPAATAAEAEPVPGLADAPTRGHQAPTVPPSIRRRGPRVRRIVADSTGRPRIDTPWRPLGHKAARGLSRRPGRRDDHSAFKHAPARSMALAGWTEAEGLALVRDAQSSPALEYLRTERHGNVRRPRDEDDTRRLWARVWSLAVEDAARMPRRPEDDGRHGEAGDAQRAVADLMTRMQTAGPARWSRQSGPADAAILHALALLMLLSNSTDISADVRRVGLLAGYTAQTASVAMWRLIADGWITVTAEAERRAGKARRVTLAVSHECTDHHRHRCAIYSPTDHVSPDHMGSDRSGTRAAPAPLSASVESLRAVLAHQQADVWHHLGHHAARTLWTLQQRGRCTPTDLMGATSYSRRATLSHLHRLTALQMVTTGPSRRGEPTYRVSTVRSPYEAAQEVGTAGRMAALAARYRTDQAVSDWWAAEETYRSLPYAQRSPRVAADQTVLPGMDPRGRAYPRTPDRRPDHDAARRIEAERIGAPGIAEHAQQLARAGQLIDLPRLTATGAETNQPAPQPARTARRAAIASRYHCPYCAAAPGERCVVGGTQRRFKLPPASRWHSERRRIAERAEREEREERAAARHTGQGRQSVRGSSKR
ncbi:hypothetical protein OG275_38200 (plasmid) [Streptomyces niveus]|uniref:zinc finger domain-containing protein n=1 Tax=Streptomyces niveus TaxID=193462 RepID=UPI002E369140|nr:hypothetical protein [Streptomyces niveus]